MQQQQQDHPVPPAHTPLAHAPFAHIPATQQGQQIVHLNWSHFKPEYLEKQAEDAEAHLLCTNDWITAHHFVEGVKVQRFCLILLGEARLWYHSLELINVGSNIPK